MSQGALLAKFTVIGQHLLTFRLRERSAVGARRELKQRFEVAGFRFHSRSLESPNGVVDELEIALAPVLFGGGRRLFENLREPGPQFRIDKVLDSPAATHLRYVRQ